MSSTTLELGGLFDVSGRTAIVTGVSSGLGERFVRVLHAAGANIVGCARRAERLAQLERSLGNERIVSLTGDITEERVRRTLVVTAIEQFGALDILVNNAGRGNVTPAEDEDIDDFRSVVDINLVATFSLCQLAANYMLKRGQGSIINVASMLGLVASAPVRQASYCASKGAVVSLTRELGVQWARRGVRVNALAPGWFRSEMAATMFEDGPANEFMVRNCPMGRGGESNELDGALLFLASTASSYVTGQVLVVDGGWTSR